MLSTCVVNNWPLDSYLHPDHPLQIACRQELEALSGEKVSLTTIEGCGAPLYQISLSGLASAIHKLTISQDEVHKEVVTACTSHP
ncbi:MAG: asparaginase [Actinomycetota bacterium]